MTITVEATFENGQLKLKEPVVLAEGTPVRLTITPVDADYDPLEAGIGIGASGRTDGADNHDKYIYGPKAAKAPTPANTP
jgi:predicted DNA-binding antitoxin AbrB/MazE fold protein